MKIIDALMSLFAADHPDTVMDHVPVQGNVAAKKFAKARAQAAKRHGKTFATDIKKPRETPPSRDLQELNARSRPVSNVRSLKSGAK